MTRAAFLAAAALLSFSLGAAPEVAQPEVQKGILVLQVGSDWCVSGESVRRVFESSAFKKAVGGRYELAVYDDMDAPTEEVKAKNAAVKDFLVRTKRFPAITCYAPGTPPRVFAQLENISMDVTVERLVQDVARVTAKKNRAEELFKKAAAASGVEAADLYGEGFNLLVPMMGYFHSGELKKGKAAWKKEWEELRKLDANDKFGWVKHFDLDIHKCVDVLGRVTNNKDAKLAKEMLSVPRTHLSVKQKQFLRVLEFVQVSDGTGKPLKPRGRKLLKEVLELGRDTFWGQFALGRLKMDGEKIASKKLYRAPVRPRPEDVKKEVKIPFPLDMAKSKIESIKSTDEITERQKLDIARYAVLRLIGQKAWEELVSRPGAGRFIKAFLSDRTWLEDFAWSGTFASGKAEPGDGAGAVLALESLIYQDGGRWCAFTGGKFSDNAGRRFMTALALVYPDKDEAWLADVLDAYRTTAFAGRLHKTAYGQPVWQWRFAVNHGRVSSGTDNMAAQQRHLDKFLNIPSREYGGTCWMVAYRLKNCLGDSVHGPLYYKPWATAGEWPKRKYTQIVGGVCGELSKFGSATANAHGLPSTTAGQPGHCAYTRRLPGGKWVLNNSVTGHSQMHMCFWNRHSWQYVTAMEGMFSYDRDARLSAERFVTLAALSHEAGAEASVVDGFYQRACRRCPKHYGVRKAYGDWVWKSNAPLDAVRAWARGCAFGMKGERQPLWDLLTPFLARVAKEEGDAALADELVFLAPFFRQPETRIEEEADFRAAVKEWTKPLKQDKDLLAKVLKAMLSAQYGTRDYFSQTLGWGSDVMMADGAGTASFMTALNEMLADRVREGKKAELDFNPLMLAASKAGNLEAFRQLASLQERIAPKNATSGQRYPESDFGAQLLSDKGLLKISSTSGWDRPGRYAKCIDASPCEGDANAFHTGREKSPWAVVMLPGAAEVCGVVVENRCGMQNRGRQVPIEVQLSEDGDNWQTVFTDGQVRATYRVDISSGAKRAKFVRVRRTPENKDEFFHLTKILVYGRPLY